VDVKAFSLSKKTTRRTPDGFMKKGTGAGGGVCGVFACAQLEEEKEEVVIRKSKILDFQATGEFD
jgi:mevalonate kinase